MRAVEVGIAIGNDLIAARWGTSEWAVNLPDGPTTEAIHNARSELARVVGTKKRVRAYVAILPPFVQFRRIELPRMSNEDHRLAVSTNAERHFLNLGQAPICGTIPFRGRKRGHHVPVLAFAASRELLERIAGVLGGGGWTIERIVPAQAVWVTAELRQNPRSRRGTVSIGARLKREINIIEVEAGSIKCVRRLCGTDDFEPIESGRTWRVIGTGEPDDSAAMAAAAGAKYATRFEIVPDSSRRERAARDRNVTRLFVAAACVSLVASAIAFRWQLDQQAAIVVLRRAAIQASASRAIASRDSARRFLERVAALAELERSAPRWSAVLSHIVIALPGDAELSSLRAESDSVMIDGQAQDASRVVSSLKRARGVRSTRVASPIVHEALANEAASERWRLAVRVDHQAASRR